MSSWVFRGSGIFFRGYIVGLRFSLVGMSWSINYFRGYFVGPKVLLMGISWVKNFSHRYLVGRFFFLFVFRESKVFSREYFLGPFFFSYGCFVGLTFSFLWLISWFKEFQLFNAWKRVTKNKNTWIHLKLRILFQIDFNNCDFCSY